MGEITYTQDEYAEFASLLDAVESFDQVTRISGRLNMGEFVSNHGKEKCDAMFELLK